jgi:diadenylate cyclase
VPSSLLSIDLLELLIELALIWFVVYGMVRFLRGTRGAGIVKGFAVLLAAFVILQLLGLGTERFARLNFIVNYLVGIVAVLLIVIFQPELDKPPCDSGRLGCCDLHAAMAQIHG